MGTLYDTIIDLCNKKGIKGAKMCADLGFSKGTLTELKMGRQKTVTADKAQKIAAYFGVSVGYLLGSEELSTVEKNNDLLVAVTIRAQRDPQFYKAVEALYNLDSDKLAALMLLMK